jgi:uncharacterized secreted repeat protein (TIGR03808 family)
MASRLQRGAMMLSRRLILGQLAAIAISPAALAQARADTARAQREIDEATRAGRPWRVPAGLTLASGLRLSDGAHLVGQPGRSRLSLLGDGPLLIAARAGRITLEGVAFDGAGRAGGRDKGLLQFSEIADLRIDDCNFSGFGGNGLLLERCGGRIMASRFADIGRGAIFANDSRGLAIDGNLVERSGENGVMVWRSAKGDDGTIIRANRILDTRNTAGGSGEYGNAIGLYRAGGVIVDGNVIRRAAYTAVRNNGGSNVTVSANNIAGCGEVALYSEFAFDGAVISGNIVADAWVGIEVTNFADHGGRLASVTGNLIRNIRMGRHASDGSPGGGKGVFVEGDAALAGNVVERAERCGLQLGWGPSLRDITATGNTLRDCGNGVEISVAPGAGRATLVGNTISGAKRRGIVGMQWTKEATGDLLKDGAKDWPNIRLADNSAW